VPNPLLQTPGNPVARYFNYLTSPDTWGRFRERLNTPPTPEEQAQYEAVWRNMPGTGIAGSIRGLGAFGRRTAHTMRGVPSVSPGPKPGDALLAPRNVPPVIPPKPNALLAPVAEGPVGEVASRIAQAAARAVPSNAVLDEASRIPQKQIAGPITAGSIQAIAERNAILDPTVAGMGHNQPPLQDFLRSQLPPDYQGANLAEAKRLHLQREASDKPYPGAPKNPRTVIPAKPGLDLPDIVIGDITPQDWIARTETLLDSVGIRDAGTWYKTVYEEFDRVTNGNREQMLKLGRAFLAAQQNTSPGGALEHVLFIQEQLNRGVEPEDIQGKGLDTARDAALDMLLSRPVRGGVGQKIADFIDSGEMRHFLRAIMDNDEWGGSPVVVDIHTARDFGMVDKGYLNHLTRLGFDVPEGVQLDLSKGGIKGAPYENRAIFGRQLTEHLNGIRWQGRDDWTTPEVQAVGWMAMNQLYGGVNTGGTTASALNLNLRSITFEGGSPGEGSPRDRWGGEMYGKLPEADQIRISRMMTDKIVAAVSEHLGVDLSHVVNGTGGWGPLRNPSAVLQGYMSRDTARSAANMIAYLGEQTEVWAQSAQELTANPKNVGIDFWQGPGQSDLRSPEGLDMLLDAIDKLDETDMIAGFAPMQDAAGNVGVRFIINEATMKEWAAANNSSIDKARAYLEKFYNTTLNQVVDNLGFDIDSLEYQEIVLDIAGTNWRDDPDGQNIKSAYNSAQGGHSPTRTWADWNNLREELTANWQDAVSTAYGPIGQAQEARLAAQSNQLRSLRVNPNFDPTAPPVSRAGRTPAPGGVLSNLARGRGGAAFNALFERYKGGR